MQLTPEQLMEIFVHRKDCFATQQDSGAYFPTKRPLMIHDIKNHLLGVTTVGLYCLTPDNNVAWACVDIDSDSKGTDVSEMLRIKKEAKTCYDLFSDFPRMLEFSGRKGYHIWIFFRPITQALYAQTLVKARLNTMVRTCSYEIFPKQTELNESRKYGNLVKLPLAYHKVSKKKSKIIKMEGVL